MGRLSHLVPTAALAALAACSAATLPSRCQIERVDDRVVFSPQCSPDERMDLYLQRTLPFSPHNSLSAELTASPISCAMRRALERRIAVEAEPEHIWALLLWMRFAPPNVDCPVDVESVRRAVEPILLAGRAPRLAEIMDCLSDEPSCTVPCQPDKYPGPTVGATVSKRPLRASTSRR